MACLWWFLSSNLDGSSHKWYDPVLTDSPLFDKYVGTLYFIFTTLATVGYGDFIPVTLSERLVVCVIMLVGTTSFGYLIASIGGILAAGLNRSSMIAQDRVAEISAYMQERNTPRELSQEIIRYNNQQTAGNACTLQCVFDYSFS